MSSLLQVTAFQMAGGNQLDGLKVYKKPIQKAQHLLSENVRSGDTFWKCHTVVLALINILIFGGAAACLAFSGGVNALHLFVPGCGLGALGLSLMTGIFVSVIKDVLQQESLKKAVQEAKEKKVDPLPILRNQNLSVQQIAAVLREFTEAEKKKVLEELKKGGPLPENLILACFAFRELFTEAHFEEYFLSNPRAELLEIAQQYFVLLSTERQAVFLEKVGEKKESNDVYKSLGKCCIESLLTSDFVKDPKWRDLARWEKTSDPDVQKDRDLLIQMMKGSMIMGKFLFEVKNNLLEGAEGFLDLVFEKFPPKKRDTFLKGAIESLNNETEEVIGKLFSDWILKEVQRPDGKKGKSIFCFLMKAFPAHLAQLVFSISLDSTARIELALQIVEDMELSERKKFYKAFNDKLQNSSPEFRQKVITRLIEKAKDPSRRAWKLLTEYFISNSQEFRKYLRGNENQVIASKIKADMGEAIPDSFK